MSGTYSWAQMLDEFRQLGGVAENVEQRRGHHGNGLFPVDPAQPIRIKIPEPLLLDMNQLVLDGDDLVVAADAAVPDKVRGFIARYQRHFSWGADGRHYAEAFEKGLRALPEPLLKRLQDFRLVNLAVRKNDDGLQRLRQRFLHSRCIRYHDRHVLMPIIELVNHAPRSPAYQIGKGIELKGQFADEVTVNYSPHSDALMRFFSYGFANAEPPAYSLPIQLKLGNGKLVRIAYDTGRTAAAGKLPLPELSVDGDSLRLSHLRIGMMHAPRLPRTLLRKTLGNWQEAEVDELFDRVRSINLIALTELLELAEGVDTEVGRELRAALRHQLRALAQCYGVRTDLS